MHDNRTHPLLQQVPLTVSPFVTLPAATTLPYQYKPLPSTLPPSVITPPTTTTTTSTTSAAAAAAADEDPNNPTPSASSSAAAAAADQKPKYVVSRSGHAAHPEQVLETCRALHAHVAQLAAQAERDLAALEARIRARDLAEKRRLAPGWLDSDARLLEPERAPPPPRPASGGASVGAGAGLGLGQSLGQGQSQGQGSDKGMGNELMGNAELKGQAGGMGGGQGSGGLLSQSQAPSPSPWLLQQPTQQGLDGSAGVGYGGGYGHGPAGPSEMAVPDEAEQLDRVFGKINLGKGKS